MRGNSLAITVACALQFFGATIALAQAAPPDTFESKYCSGCHAVDKKMVGPSIKDIAAKYKGKADAASYLSDKIKKGGVGVWGQVPMPPNETLTDAELKTLADWILKA